MLKKKIEKLISLIENTEIEEIEVSSFWGAQKIKLSKSKSAKNISIPYPDNKKSQDSIDLKDVIPDNIKKTKVPRSDDNLGLNQTDSNPYEEDN